MRLSYRGVSYEQEVPTLEVTEGEILGKYRGAGWRCRTLVENPVAQPAFDLKYRGLAYPANQATAREAAIAHQKAEAMAIQALSPSTVRRELLAQMARIHSANIRSNLERRLQVAKAKGDQKLISLLEAEQRQLVC